MKTNKSKYQSPRVDVANMMITSALLLGSGSGSSEEVSYSPDPAQGSGD